MELLSHVMVYHNQTTNAPNSYQLNRQNSRLFADFEITQNVLYMYVTTPYLYKPAPQSSGVDVLDGHLYPSGQTVQFSEPASE